MNGRIGYIDSLKGLSMLMVVVGHIIIFCTLNYDNEFVRHIVLINMPLFFFLNGLVVKRLQMGGVIYGGRYGKRQDQFSFHFLRGVY